MNNGPKEAFGRINSKETIPVTGKKIILILPWMVTGGADKFNLSLVEHLCARGWGVTIAATLSAESSWEVEFKAFTHDIFILPSFLQLEEYPLFLRNLISTRRADIVLISNSELAYLLLPYLRHYCPEPIYLDYCHMEELEWCGGGFPALSVKYKQFLDANLVASKYLKRWMVDHGGEENRIHVCYINVDTKKWCPNKSARMAVRRSLGVDDDNTPIIFYAARLCRQKLPFLLAETIRELKNRSNHFHAIVAGDGEDAPALARFVRKHKLEDHLWLLGNVSIARMHELMAAADIFFLPSQNEGISLAIYEAMASGLAVVAADVGGQHELVVDGTGILVKVGTNRRTQKKYVDALEPLLKDFELRQQMGAAAREWVEKEFSLRYMADTFEIICLLVSRDRRSATEAIDADSVADKAVRYIRAFGKERETLMNLSLPIKIRCYAVFTRFFDPLYFWCLDHQFKWAITLKNSFRKIMGVDEL